MKKYLSLILLVLSACGSENVATPQPGVTVLKKTGSEDITLVANRVLPGNTATNAVYAVPQALRITIPHAISAPDHGNTGDWMTLSFGSIDCSYSNVVATGVFEWQSCALGYTQFNTVDLTAGELVQLSVNNPVSATTTGSLTLTGTYL